MRATDSSQATILGPLRRRRAAKGTCLVVLAATLAVCLAGCGRAGGSSSPEEDAKAVVTDFLEAVIDDRNGEACALTTDPGECIGALALAKGFVGEGGFEALLGDDWREELDAADVTFTDDDHLTIAPLTAEDDPTKLVREDGEWLIVYEE